MLGGAVWQAPTFCTGGICQSFKFESYGKIGGFRLSYAPEEIFVDAASSWGIGGFYGDNYFMIPNRDLARFHKLFQECIDKGQMVIPPKELPIAYLEL